MKTPTTTGALLLILLAGGLLSCGGGSAPPRDDGPTPILKRPIAGPFACSVSRGATSHAPKGWTNLSALQAVASGTAFLARAEWDLAEDVFRHHAFVVSSLGLDGTLGAPLTIPVDDADGILAMAAAPRGQGFALVWADEQTLHFAAFDGEGALVGPPTLITTLDRDPNPALQVHLAAGPSGSGFAVVLSLRKDVDEIAPFVLFLDADGAARGPLRRLGTPTNNPDRYHYPDPEVIATRDGYAFVWSDRTEENGHLFFTRTDALGAELAAPTVFTRTSGKAWQLNDTGFVGGRARIAETASGFVAAWSESYWGDIDGGRGAWSVVRLVLLDPQGVPTGPSAALRASEEDVDEVEPVLTPFGDALAVTWGRGAHIYWCAGCVPDHRIDFVLVDPTSLSPLSNVVTVSNGGGTRAGGLLRKQVAPSGSSFLTLYDRRFHTSAEPGSAVFSCAR